MTPFEKAARAHAASRAAIGTRALYQRDLDRWLAWCVKQKADPTKPKLADATAYRDELQSNEKPLTVRRKLAALSSMYEAAINQERPLATWNPWRKLPRPPADMYARTEALSTEECELLLDAAKIEADGGCAHTMLLLMYETGLRRASVASLRRDDVIVREGKTVARVTVKGGKYREVELPPRAAAALRYWGNVCPIKNAYVFPDKNGNAIDPRTINKILNHIAAVAGVAHAHPHRFRASYATVALDAGVPLHEVQASMHHSSPDITQRYDRGRRGGGVSDLVAEFRKGKR